MGKSTSNSSQSIRNKTVNKNTINTLNETIMNSAVETIIKNASSCSSAINANNSCDMSNAKIGGDFTFGGNQIAQAKVNFNCIQANETSADMATAMMASMVAEMKSLNGTESAANLNNASQSSNKSGFASMPSSSGSNAKTNETNNVTNKTISNVKNIFEQNLNNNFSVNTVNECIGKTNISNTQDLSNMDIGGSAKIECIQTASVDQVQNCKQLSSAIQKTTQSTLQELGLVVESESDTGTSTESTVASKSENVATGPIEEAGNAISSIVGAVGLAYLGPIIGSVVIMCAVIILLGVLGFVASQFLSSENGGKLIDKIDTQGMGASGMGLSGMGLSGMGLSGMGLSGTGSSGTGSSGTGSTGTGSTGMGSSGIGSLIGGMYDLSEISELI